MKIELYYDFSILNIASFFFFPFTTPACISTVCEENLYHPCTGPCFCSPTIVSAVDEDAPKINPTFVTLLFVIQYQWCTQNQIQLQFSNQKG